MRTSASLRARGSSLRRRWRLATSVVSALALVAGLLIGIESHFAGWGRAPDSDPGSPVAVHLVHGRKVYIPPMRPYRLPPTVWPAAQTAAVTVAGMLARAGDTPVFIGPARVSSLNLTAAEGGTPTKVQVSTGSYQAALAAGVHGLVFALTTAAGSPGGRVHVAVDYSRFAHAYGGDYAGRLHLVELPACALTTPQLASCRTQVPVRSGAGNDVHAQLTGGDVALPGTPGLSSAVRLLADTSPAGVVLAATAAPSGDGGNFTVPAFSDANEWVNGGSSGTYSSAYQIKVPPVPGGFAPTVSLQYSSQVTDGLTSATNNEASWIGDGWDYQAGFIEQDYPSCNTLGSGVTGLNDLCDTTGSDPGLMPLPTLNLNGIYTTIVPDGTAGEYKAEADNGATVTFANGSWVLTQRDGTKYYFGLEQLPGYAAGDAVTGSAWTVPVATPTLVQNGATFSTRTWRWNLDYVTDRDGSAIAYYYNPQTSWYAEASASTGTGQYTRGGTLARITYGFQDGHAYDQAPPGEVDFTTTGGRQDAPQDLACGQGTACSVTEPTFWTDQQLTTITTKTLAGSSQRPVDSWVLSQTFPATGDPLTAPSLWLSSITQTGQDGTTPITLPLTSFAGTPMPNRVMAAADTNAGYSPITRFRLTSITTPTGGVTTLAYTPQDATCAAGNFPAPDANATACYPGYWQPSAGGSQVEDWWNVYAVKSKTLTDTTGGDPPIVTSYTYTGPAWHDNNDAVTRSATRTYDQWRGFRTITTETGTAPDPVTQSVGTWFQGTGATLTSSRGTTAADKNQYAGMVFEEISYNGQGGPEVTDTINDVGTLATTATGTGSWSSVTANIVGDNDTATYTTLAGGGAREGSVSYKYDTKGRVIEEYDEPDVSDPSQWTCTTRAYGAFDLVTEQDTYSYVKVNSAELCPTITSAATVAQMQADAINAIANTYDSTGNLTRLQAGTGIIAAGTGTCPADTIQDPHIACWNWQTTLTSTYDSYGRELTSTDADNRTTTTSYTPAAGAEPTSITVTDPIGLVTTTSYDPARDLPLTVNDPAGYQTIKAYDALGRLTSEWAPGNPASGPADSTYSYRISNSGPSYSTEQTEEPGGGYLTTVTIADSLGQSREIQKQTASGGSDITDTSYNSDGWKAVTSSPYYSSSPPSGTLVTASSVPSQTGYVYDGDGRVIKQIAYKNGTETWETDSTYGGNYTTVVPPQGGTSQTAFTDGRGLTTAIYQYHAGMPADPSDPAADYDKTSYTYTPAGKLAGITDAAGNTWSYAYDLLGNQLTQSMPDSGTTTSTYDAAGQLMNLTDARGKTTSYTYDSDGRKTAAYDTTGGALESPADQISSFTYDTLAKGRPTSSTSYVNGAQYTEQVTGYNTQALPSGTAVIIPSAQGALAGTYTSQYTYAPTGQMISYADSAAGGLPAETVTTGYDNAGEENSLTGAITYVTGVSYTTLGQPLQYTMGSSAQPVYITDSWDPQTGRISEQNTQTGTGQASIDDLHYAYDNAGNVTSVADTPAGATTATDVQCFQNDYAGRLVQAWAQASSACASTPSASAEGGAAPYWNSYTYDVTGNLTGITATSPAGAVTTTAGTYPSPGTPRPHAISSQKVTSPAGTLTSSYSYDNAGNMTSVSGTGPSQTYTWNDPGELAKDTVTPAAGGAAQTTSYIYNATGALLITADPGTVTLSLGDEQLSLATGTGTITGTRYYSFNGNVIATRTGASSIAYLAGNSQGTDSVAIDAATLNITRRWYDPYGNPRGTAPAGFPAGQEGFIGGTADTATGLTNLGAREYQPSLSAFITTDLVQQPYDPQDLNPYAYGKGAPGTLSDPAGARPDPPRPPTSPGTDPPPSGSPGDYTPPPPPPGYDSAEQYCSSVPSAAATSYCHYVQAQVTAAIFQVLDGEDLSYYIAMAAQSAQENAGQGVYLGRDSRPTNDSEGCTPGTDNCPEGYYDAKTACFSFDAHKFAECVINYGGVDSGCGWLTACFWTSFAAAGVVLAICGVTLGTAAAICTGVAGAVTAAVQYEMTAAHPTFKGFFFALALGFAAGVVIAAVAGPLLIVVAKAAEAVGFDALAARAYSFAKVISSGGSHGGKTLIGWLNQFFN